MKRAVSIFLTVLMLTLSLIPTSTYAQEEKGLEQAIKTVKQKISIPSGATEFSYYVATRDDKKVWNLSWSDKNGKDGNVNVEVDDKGKITSFNYYKNYAQPQNPLPKLSKSQAETMAKDFIKKIDAKLLPQLKLNESSTPSLMEPSFNFNFVRMVNNISFYDNYVAVNVDRMGGYVQSYYTNWTDNLTFPSTEKILSTDDAKKAYKDNIGLTLMYKYKMDGERAKAYLVYVPKYSNYYIDALTGEKVKLQDYYRGPYFGRGGDMMKENAKADVKLTPQEQNAVEELSGMITRENAEKIARDIKELGLTNDYKVENISLSKDWYPSKNMTWSLEFRKTVNEKEGQYYYANARIDAKSGEVKSFNSNTNISGEAKGKVDEAAAKDAVVAFLKTFNPDKYKNTIFDDNRNDDFIPYYKSSDEKPTYYSFRFMRTVNGIPFNDNYLMVGYDAVNCKVTSYENVWFDMAFIPAKRAVSVEKAYEKLFNDAGFELQYSMKYNNDVMMKYKPIMEQKGIKPEVKLVYGVNARKPAIIDAFKNILLNYDGEPYRENKANKYTDIDDSFAKDQITKLSEYGIGFDGDKFKPNDNISQKDYLYLLCKVFYPYDVMTFTSKKDTDRMYETLIREGVVKEDEKSADKMVTKEDTVKFLIRAMKLDKVASIKGIYNYPFKDVENANPELLGHIAIAKGMNIISETEYFAPKNHSTRAQAAVILYNYLQTK